MVLILLLGVIGIFHAFRIRKEYLLRLEALQTPLLVTETDAVPKQRPTSEQRLGTLLEESDRQMNSSGLSKNRAKLARSPGNERPAGSSVSGSSGVEEKGLSDKISISHFGAVHDLENYPLPLAFGYSLLESKWDSRDRYSEQLRFAENILAFLGSISLALLPERDRTEVGIDLESYWQGGISPGDWKDIIGRCSKAFSTYEEQSLASFVQKLNIRSEKKGFGKDVAELVREKNDYKHDRGPTIEEDIIAASNEVQDRLDRCMESLSFFVNYPIRLVQDFDISRYGDEFVLKCLRYTGDGPGFRQERMLYHKALPKGDLFLDLGTQNWTSLYPFVTTMNCPRCKFREMFFIDRWDRKKSRVQLKSFERGHTEENGDIAGTLEQRSSSE